MTSRTKRPLVAVLIRIGLLLALAILLLVEKSQAQTNHFHSAQQPGIALPSPASGPTLPAGMGHQAASWAPLC